MKMWLMFLVLVADVAFGQAAGIKEWRNKNTDKDVTFTVSPGGTAKTVLQIIGATGAVVIGDAAATPNPTTNIVYGALRQSKGIDASSILIGWATRSSSSGDTVTVGTADISGGTNSQVIVHARIYDTRDPNSAGAGGSGVYDCWARISRTAGAATVANNCALATTIEGSPVAPTLAFGTVTNNAATLTLTTPAFTYTLVDWKVVARTNGGTWSWAL